MNRKFTCMQTLLICMYFLNYIKYHCAGFVHVLSKYFKTTHDIINTSCQKIYLFGGRKPHPALS